MQRCQATGQAEDEGGRFRAAPARRPPPGLRRRVTELRLINGDRNWRLIHPLTQQPGP